MKQHHRSALAALVLASLASSSVVAADHWARLPSTQRAAAQAAGVTIIEDHGGWLWARGDAQALVTASAEAIADAGATFQIDLGSERFDLIERFPNALQGIARETHHNLHLIQLTGPTRTAYLDELASRGVHAVQYIHPFSYVVWASGSELAQAADNLPAIRWAGAFLPEWRTHASLRGVAGSVPARAMIYRGATIDSATLQAATGRLVDERESGGPDFEIVTMSLDAASIEALLEIPGVYAVESIPTDGGLRGEVSMSISAGLFNGSGVPIPGYLPWLATLGYNGSGVIMANVDGGVADTHPVLVNRMLPCTGSTCGLTLSSTHGTHTAAAMAGDASGGVTIGNGFLRGVGTAPAANLIEQRYSPTFTQAGGMLTLMRQSYQNNAVLSGNSWGPAASPRGYDGDTRQVDVGSRDTDDVATGDQPLIYFLSIMNGNGGTSTQGSPDEAKNVITVGSTRSESTAGVPLTTIGNVSSNSGHGPALDGRRIPHLVAPGCSTDSATTATAYGLNCGTSMASPIVAGAGGLFTQFYRTRFAGANPSPAVTKAALLAATQDLFGGTNANGGALTRRPNNQQGWGRMRIDWLLSTTESNWYYDQQHVFLNTGENWTRTLRPVDPTKPVVVMLAFSDAPGHGLGGSTPAWNNDLDLSVTTNAVNYRGNVFGTDGYSATGGTADASNNAEGVALRSDQLGTTLTVSVAATLISSKALPNAASTVNQDFAIVCTNCTEAPPLPDLIFRQGFDGPNDVIFRNGFDSTASP